MLKNYLVFIVVIFAIQVTQLAGSPPIFCSSVCKPNNCDNSTSNGCKNGCDIDFMQSGNTCIVNPNSGYTEVDTSTDYLNGSMTPDQGSNTNCGPYSFWGNYSKNDIITVRSLVGVTLPFYSIKLVYWLILIDWWDIGTVISNTLIQANSQKNNSRPNVEKTTDYVCGIGSNTQKYLKIVNSWSFNSTNVPLDFEIKMLNNSQNNFWGVKQFQLLAKLCNLACASCWSNLVSNCWTCDTVNSMLLNNNTCNQSCLTGYGPTTDGMTCVWCNLRCTQCFQTMDNCSACTKSGKWTSYLFIDNFTCVATCPNGYFANKTSFTCDLCNQNCSKCVTQQNHCLQCIPTFGWNSYTCYSPCPLGTYPDLTHPVYNGSINCTICQKYCISCTGPSTNCTSCTLSGTYKAYQLNNTCVKKCPPGYYAETYNNTGPNECLVCNLMCTTCTNYPSPCQSCKPNYYLFEQVCGLTCNQPTYFADDNTWSCLLCQKYCVVLAIKMYFPDSISSKMYIDMKFTQDLNFSSFSMETFQTISTDSTFVTLSMFNISYVQTSARSYRIILVPKGYIFIYNITFTVITENQPLPVDRALNQRPFNKLNYQMSDSLKWFLIKAPEMSTLEQKIINGLATINNKVSWFTTLPYVQQIKKTGVFSLLMGGAQITSCSVLVNTIPSQNMYEGVRFWANFVFFDVPQWEQNSKSIKYAVVPPIKNIIKDSRLLTAQQTKRMLFDTSAIDWRFQRTGHTSFFIFDCYMNILLIIVCWTLLLIGKCIIKKKKSLKQHLGKFYSLLHKIHQISILYISLTTLLEWIYFDSSSIERWISFGLCLLFNLYFLAYQLYIYYDMLKYPAAQVGNENYEYYLIKYGSFLKNIRYQQYDPNQDWTPKQWIRPYNYHCISYYKKLMMMVSLPLFYDMDNAQIYVLAILQFLQILRFCFTWPFKTKARNVIRLILQFTLLMFFVSIAIQHFIIQKVVNLDPTTQSAQLQSSIKLFFYIGWGSFIMVFLFNIGHITTFLFDLCKGCKISNRQLMDQARRNFYMQKLKSYEQQNQDTPLALVNKWVKLGNLNQRNFELLPNIKLRIQYYRVTRANNGFWVQMKKIIDVFMNTQFDFNKQNNLTVGKKINKQFLLQRSLSSQFYQHIYKLYQKYAMQFQFQSMIIKTFQQIQQSQHKAGQKIQLQYEKMTQKLQFEGYNNQKKTLNLKQVMKGFPIDSQYFRHI